MNNSIFFCIFINWFHSTICYYVFPIKYLRKLSKVFESIRSPETWRVKVRLRFLRAGSCLDFQILHVEYTMLRVGLVNRHFCKLDWWEIILHQNVKSHWSFFPEICSHIQSLICLLQMDSRISFQQCNLEAGRNGGPRGITSVTTKSKTLCYTTAFWDEFPIWWCYPFISSDENKSSRGKSTQSARNHTCWKSYYFKSRFHLLYYVFLLLEIQ